jgi:dienelactone hydrolase
MRITRRRAATFLIALFFLFILRRGLLVLFLASKILGEHPEALDAWKGPVPRQTVVNGGIPIDIYGAGKSLPAILIVHGVNPTGKNSLDLVRISEGLAQVGYQVYVPDFVEMKRVHLLPEEAGRIKSAFQFIGRDAGIACFSYGCGPALIAVADAGIRSHVRFALAFGGYFDIREAWEYVVTGPQSTIGYLKSAYLEANLDTIADEGERESLLQIFSATSPEDFRARLHAGPENLQRRLDALSPSRYLQQIRAPLILVHGANDPVIPAQQTIELADAARANGIDYTLTLLRIYGHVNPILPRIGLASVFGFYVPETFRFLRLVNQVIGYS